MSNLAWTIISGQAYCQIYGANCVTDGYGSSYGGNEHCSISANTQLSASSTYFATEFYYDTLTIGSNTYSGSTGPVNVPMLAGATMTWTSDNSVHDGGFTICATTCATCLGTNGICYPYTCGSMCQWTDCNPPPYPPAIPPVLLNPPPPILPLPLGCMCTTVCIGNPAWSNDGFCDDGGAGAEYSGCLLGTDCEDCGVRCQLSPAPPPTPPGCICATTCIGSPLWNNDGYCDDGGVGAEFSGCQIGTDCIDCGMRCDLTVTIVSSPPPFGISSSTLPSTSSSTLEIDAPPSLPPTTISPKSFSPPPRSPQFITVTVRAAGSIGDYEDTSQLQARFAFAAGVNPSHVAITVVAASVLITAKISIPTSNTAGSVMDSLNANLGSASVATSTLGITVEQVLSISQSPGDSATVSSSSSSVGLIAGGGGGLVAIVGIGAAVYLMKMRAKK
eukprot:88282-Prymnesium_polylepis.1